MNYKVGDKVKVRKDLVVDKNYGGYDFVSNMEEFEGKIVTIESVDGDHYHIEEDKFEFKFGWVDEMFEPVITNWDKVKERIEEAIGEMNVNNWNANIFCNSIHATRGEKDCSGMACRNCKEWLKQPYQEPSILNDTEKEYLKAVIKPWRKRIISIKVNIFDEDSEYISIKIKDDALSTSLPTFKEGAMYKGMIRGMEYTLEDLDL